MKLDLEKSGVNALFTDYQAKSLLVVNNSRSGIGSREVWEKVNILLDKSTISRASIINFCEEMCEEKIFTYTEITGKGGHRKIYKMGLERLEFERFIRRKFEMALNTVFEDANWKSIWNWPK